MGDFPTIMFHEELCFSPSKVTTRGLNATVPSNVTAYLAVGHDRQAILISGWHFYVLRYSAMAPLSKDVKEKTSTVSFSGV